MQRSLYRLFFLVLAAALPLAAQASVTATQVQNLYVAYFGRPADPIGLAFQVSNASDLTSLSNSLGASTEYLTRFAGMTQDQKVDQIITTLFSRSGGVAEIAFWSNELTTGSVSFAQIARSIATGAQPADATILANKVTAAEAFTAAVDTVPEINGYTGAGAHASARSYIAGVSDSTSLANATTSAAVGAAVAAAVAAGPTSTPTVTRTNSPSPTVTPSATPTSSITPSRTVTASPTATPSPSPTRTATVTATASPSPTPTVSFTKTSTPTDPQLTQTSVVLSWTPTPAFLMAPADGPVFGPVPARRGEPVCLSSPKALGTVKVTLYNTVGEVVSTLESSGGQPCLSTNTYAAGIYDAVIETDGKSVTQKIAIVP